MCDEVTIDMNDNKSPAAEERSSSEVHLAMNRKLLLRGLRLRVGVDVGSVSCEVHAATGESFLLHEYMKPASDGLIDTFAHSSNGLPRSAPEQSRKDDGRGRAWGGVDLFWGLE
jgi:hypothetical protein